MNRIAKVALAASVPLFSPLPALAHPGHGFDNPVLHRIHHFLAGLDPAWAALAVGAVGLTLAAVLYARSRRVSRR
jgi:hydrogenase/urease accessory protein HupE